MTDSEKKGGKTKIQKFEYLENEKSFLDEIKNIFHSFCRAIIWQWLTAGKRGEDENTKMLSRERKELFR